MDTLRVRLSLDRDARLAVSKPIGAVGTAHPAEIINNVEVQGGLQ